MSIYEYDEEKHMRQEREQHWQEGMAEGQKEGRKKGITEGHRQVFRNMLENGYTQEEVQKLSELTDEQVLEALGEQKK